ncbi:MAG: hypothetical protein ACRDNO_11150 [Trebonia sp.]
MSEPAPARLLSWPPAVTPFAALGTACVVAGGLVAAAVGEAPSQLGAWAAAYLVLVGGVAQVALGAGQTLLAPPLPGRRTVAAELTGWNAGNGAVLAGMLLGATWLTDIGGAVLVVTLALALAGVRGAARRPSWPLHVYRVLLALVLVSIPVGLVLAAVHPSSR